jgi:hypothetical protein
MAQLNSPLEASEEGFLVDRTALEDLAATCKARIQSP